MNFELKKTEVIGNITSKDENNSMQMVSISIGVVGCPYADIATHRIIEYVFPNTTSITDLQTGALAFAQTWLEANYPNVA